jgi:predicted HNH restriction endonuclease
LELKAANLVDWFGAHFTMYKNGDKRFLRWGSLFDGFERTEIEGETAYKPITADAMHIFPDEVQEGMMFREGTMRQVLVNAYERDAGARRQCIARYGNNCFICKFSFGTRYGEVANGFIHVHHLRQLSEIRKEYLIDPIKDLRPVCPNCHAVLHLRNPAYSIEEVLTFLEAN